MLGRMKVVSLLLLTIRLVIDTPPVVSQLIGVGTTTQCPAVCPSGWITMPLSNTGHCYFLPPRPLVLYSFWDMQQYCASQHPSAYIIEINSSQEEIDAWLRAATYINSYAGELGEIWLWIGAYCENGAWRWINGDLWGYSDFQTGYAIPPAQCNGTCIYANPKQSVYKWMYRPCSDNRGSSACEMPPIVDCSATQPAITTKGPYIPPDCQQASWADFTQQSQTGYLNVGPESELIWIANMDTVSCSIACMYYTDCISFDIDKVNGDCRLLQTNSQTALCSSVDSPEGEWQHYDLFQRSGSV